MKRKGLIITLTLVLTVTAAPLLWAGHQMQRAGSEDPLMALVKLRAMGAELDLSAEQVQKLREIGRSVREANADYREAMRSNAAEAGLLLLDDPANVEGAAAILDRNDTERRELRANVLKGVAEAIGVLTPGQREILEQKLSSHGGGR